MTSFEIRTFRFDKDALPEVDALERLHNWPVVYVLNASQDGRSKRSVYFGESLNFSSRLRSHLDSPEKQGLMKARVVLDDTFNKSVCLDLESHLIKLAAGDDTLEVLNRNDGVVDANYYDRDRYREIFNDIFEELRAQGIFERSIPEIVNSELFKLSPFKALTIDQAGAVEDIMEGLSEDLADPEGPSSVAIVQGSPGTGKTVIAIYLIKLLADIGQNRDMEELDADSMFSDFFLEGFRERFAGLRVALVVPQQSLRRSIKRVFAKTPGLSRTMVMTAFDVAESDEVFDVLVVDEAHRLTQFAAQAHGSLTKRFKDANERLFAGKRPRASQLDWLRHKSKHLVLMLDSDQSVRPADLPPEEVGTLLSGPDIRRYRLSTQLRSTAGEDYIAYIRAVLSHQPPQAARSFAPYELGIVDDPARLVDTIRRKDSEYGLSRLVAGYAWKWVSRQNPQAFDIVLGETKLRWNSTEVEWVTSDNAVNECGSIHTIQGYDLNFAGVIIGPDLRYDPESSRLYIDRDSYHDKAGKRNNAMAGQRTTDEMLFRYITNVYFVLLTRGMRGTFVHVVDPGLREYLARFLPVLP